MDNVYLKSLRAAQKKQLLRSLIPAFILLFRKKMQYERRFPDCYVDMEAAVDQGAKLGAHSIIRKDCTIGSNVEIGRYTTVGLSCTMNGLGRISIGQFCSIAPECFFWSENHILDAASTYPFEQIQKGRTQDYVEYKGDDINVGHDVWIGQRVSVLAGANIGDGCVIAAGSVVPKGDYEPYSVIAGVPGKVLKKRLPEDKIQELLKMKWWDKDEQDIFGKLMPFLH